MAAERHTRWQTQFDYSKIMGHATNKNLSQPVVGASRGEKRPRFDVLKALPHSTTETENDRATISLLHANSSIDIPWYKTCFREVLNECLEERDTVIAYEDARVVVTKWTNPGDEPGYKDEEYTVYDQRTGLINYVAEYSYFPNKKPTLAGVKLYEYEQSGTNHISAFLTTIEVRKDISAERGIENSKWIQGIATGQLPQPITETQTDITELAESYIVAFYRLRPIQEKLLDEHGRKILIDINEQLSHIPDNADFRNIEIPNV